MESKLKKERNQIKKQFQDEIGQQLGFRVYSFYRGEEYHFEKPPHNTALKCIKHNEKLMVYITFSPSSTEFSKGFAIAEKDVQSRNALFTKSWGSREWKETEIIDVEAMRENPTKYPQALFVKNITLAEFKEEIVKKFANLK